MRPHAGSRKPAARGRAGAHAAAASLLRRSTLERWSSICDTLTSALQTMEQRVRAVMEEYLEIQHGARLQARRQASQGRAHRVLHHSQELMAQTWPRRR